MRETVSGNIPIEFRPERTLLEYTGDKLIYSGTNRQDALVADTTWTIKKMHYSGDILVDVQVITGAWTNRASLSWKSSGGD